MIKEQVRLDGLLFSSDTDVLGVMSQILDTFAIKTEVCAELDSAIDAVTHRRLDTVIVDWSRVNKPTRVVRAARKSSPNSNSTIVAMVDQGSEAHALLAGANFMIHKPMDHDHARRCMRAAYGTMLQNRRRAARVPVDLPVVVRVVGGERFGATISDIRHRRIRTAVQTSIGSRSEDHGTIYTPGHHGPDLSVRRGRQCRREGTGRNSLLFHS